MPETLKAPFPWFGGKSRAATLIWAALGNVRNYCEPFFGSGAVLLGRPTRPYIETVNDRDGFLCNFWRALQADPEGVAYYADAPPNENDLHARHAWLLARRATLVARLEGDPAFADPQIAGWWVWGLCLWIGSGFCSGKGPWHVVDGLLQDTRSDGQGIKRQRPHLGNAGQGVHRQLLHLKRGMGIHAFHARDGSLLAWLQALAERLRYVRVCCGDWTRVLGPSPTTKLGLSGIVLDPPYAREERADVYTCDAATLADDVRQWALERGENPLMRIVLCGYETLAYTMPERWRKVAWKTNGGYGNQGNERGRTNRTREVLWFSPHCLPPAEAAV